MPSTYNFFFVSLFNKHPYLLSFSYGCNIKLNNKMMFQLLVIKWIPFSTVLSYQSVVPVFMSKKEAPVYDKHPLQGAEESNLSAIQKLLLCKMILWAYEIQCRQMISVYRSSGGILVKYHPHATSTDSTACGQHSRLAVRKRATWLSLFFFSTLCFIGKLHFLKRNSRKGRRLCNPRRPLSV